MILTVRDEKDANLSMKLNVNCEQEKIEISVTAWNKRTHTVATKQFEAADFHGALAYFNQQEAILFGKKEG